VKLVILIMRHAPVPNLNIGVHTIVTRWDIPGIQDIQGAMKIKVGHELNWRSRYHIEPQGDYIADVFERSTSGNAVVNGEDRPFQIQLAGIVL